jgi:hypothetical protein
LSPISNKKQPLMDFANSQATTSRTDEQKEFQRQMASMHERQLAAISSSKTNNNKKSNQAPVNFQPASFSLQKSTTDLLHETVSQMQGMVGVGTAATVNNTLTPIRTNQSWAVSQGPLSPSRRNPFAALGDDDDDDDSDNEWNPKKNQQVQSAFTLAPATFSILPRTTPTPATTPIPCRFGTTGYEDEMDPDL